MSLIEGGIANAESFEVPLNYEFPLMEGGIANVESPGVPLNDEFPLLSRDMNEVCESCGIAIKSSASERENSKDFRCRLRASNSF